MKYVFEKKKNQKPNQTLLSVNHFEGGVRLGVCPSGGAARAPSIERRWAAVHPVCCACAPAKDSFCARLTSECFVARNVVR